MRVPIRLAARSRDVETVYISFIKREDADYLRVALVIDGKMFERIIRLEDDKFQFDLSLEEGMLN